MKTITKLQAHKPLTSLKECTEHKEFVKVKGTKWEICKVCGINKGWVEGRAREKKLLKGYWRK